MPARTPGRGVYPGSRLDGLPGRSLLLALTVLVALGGVPAPNAPANAASRPEATQRNSSPQTSAQEEVIVVLDDGADPVAAAAEMGITVTHIYRHVFTGFAGIAPADVAIAAKRSRSGERIFEDGKVRLQSQTVPTGVRRAAVPQQPGSDHLAIPSPVDADIAILDTGVSRVADLNVAGGTSCIGVSKEKKDKKSKKGKHKKHHKGKHNKKKVKREKKRNDKRRQQWADNHGHGTHTAGIAAAIDNDRDVVGVAPGARIWAVKVLDAEGSGFISDVICGLDWVVKQKATIDVANLSLAGTGQDGACNSSALHRAVCGTVNAGVPLVVAAGNQGTNVDTLVPASYDQVLTVSAFSDSDGLPGHLGPQTCAGFSDDTFASFSNFGPDVDIAAPGDCILSLWPDGSLRELSGTSESTPHVTGAVANFTASYLDEHGTRPTPEQTRDWLLTEASRPQDSADGFSGGPTGSDEPVLWLEDANDVVK